VYQVHLALYQKLKLMFNDANKPLNTVVVNIFSHAEELNIIFGYHSKLSNQWIKNYIESWRNNTQEQIEIKVSDLIATRN
jgi:HKD family nuclease